MGLLWDLVSNKIIIYCHLEVYFFSESSELSYLSAYVPNAFSGSFGTVHRAEWHGSVRTFYLKFAWLISKSMVGFN